MSANDYNICEQHVLASEGGYTNNPADPGGPTNWGITIFDARLYWKHNASAEDVRAMPKSIAQDIYRKKYWNALDCDDLPPGLDYTIFDYGVNSGIARSGVVLRRCIHGVPTNDWHVTPEIVDAIKRRDVKQLIADINDERLNFLHQLRTWSVFGRGWGPRVASVRSISLQMSAAGSKPGEPIAIPAPPIVPEVQAAGKGIDHAQNLLAHLAEDAWKAITSII